ncbi:phage tail assembly chaperone [bacterium]|nr:phage tail assembly chaperone [bacterium]
MIYRNARYIDASNRVVDCEISHPEFGWVPYTLVPEDTGGSVDSRKLLEIMSGRKDVADFVEPFVSEEERYATASTEVRRHRDSLLRKYFDPIASNPFRWEPLSEMERQELLDYRSALLDVTNQDGFPYNVQWPAI